MSVEQRKKGTNVLLGPMVNILRQPFDGRSFESYGEDPYLSSQLVAQSIRGIQTQSMIANVKHFIDNTQEYDRMTVSANVDDRTQHEIYYPAFEAAVNAGVLSVMCAYNKVNDTYSCNNDHTLNVGLKQEMGFKGFVVSDWGATHSTYSSVMNGLDMEMPGSTFFGMPLISDVQEGIIPQSRLDDMVFRILYAMFSANIFDTQQTGNLNANARSPEHDELAIRLGQDSVVLLKNSNNLLPISKTAKIAIIGDDAHDAPISHGKGSGYVIEPFVITPLDAIRDISEKNGGTVSYANSTEIKKAVKIASESDIAIVFVGVTSGEGHDRTTLSLGEVSNNLIKQISIAQTKTIVVIHNPGPVLMPWKKTIQSILVAWLPGQGDGAAIAPIIFGDVNPGGKLPTTFPVSDTQIPTNTEIQYPGIKKETEYSEKLLVGYRWYDAKHIEPLFPFGHGLSYTTFEYTNIELMGDITQGMMVVLATIKNTGSVFGSEVAQLYLGYPPSAGEPPKVLRGFEKVHLNPSESATISFSIYSRDISIWENGWKVVNGKFNLFIGSSSRDLRLNTTFTY
eukprot:TRINITY_DN1517_c0_g1_i1.p1 TRINITY_DN1517_c0_g1~~TRINITY_DN1517_c0_g1_i1.p1  ORF type:complete len:566 (-),score=128.00 TRINITY_DN1517_c0_g1_i1:45-1742(-)